MQLKTRTSLNAPCSNTGMRGGAIKRRTANVGTQGSGSKFALSDGGPSNVLRTLVRKVARAPTGH